MSLYVGDKLPNPTPFLPHTITGIPNCCAPPYIARRYLNFSEHSKVPLLCAHTSPIRSIATTPSDPATVATTAADGVLRVWRLTSGEAEPLAEFQSEEVCTCSSFTPDGGQLAAGYTDGTLRLFNVQTPTILWTVSGHESPVVSVQIHPTEVRNWGGEQCEAELDQDLKSRFTLRTLQCNPAAFVYCCKPNVASPNPGRSSMSTQSSCHFSPAAPEPPSCPVLWP